MYRKRGINNLIRSSIYVGLLVLADLVTLYLIFKSALYLRTEILPLIYAGFPSEQPLSDLRKVWWIFAAWIFFLSYEGLYSKRLSFWDEINALWKVAFFSTIGILTIVSLGKLSAIVSRTAVILIGILSLIVIPMVRLSV